MRRRRRVRCAAPSAVSAGASAHQRHPHAIVRALAALAPIEAVAREVVAPRPRRAPRKRPAQFARVRAAAPRLGRASLARAAASPLGAARVIVEARLVGRLRRRRRPPCHHRRAGRLGRLDTELAAERALEAHRQRVARALAAARPRAACRVCIDAVGAHGRRRLPQSTHAAAPRANRRQPAVARARARRRALGAPRRVAVLAGDRRARVRATAADSGGAAAEPAGARTDLLHRQPRGVAAAARRKFGAQLVGVDAVSSRSLCGARRRRRQLRAGVLDGVEQ